MPKPRNHGKRWTLDLNNQLRKDYLDNRLSIVELADRFGRTIGAIKSQIKKLKLRRDEKTPKSPLKTSDDEELLEELSKRGYTSVKKRVTTDETYKFPQPKEEFKIGVVSDTHIGSKHQQVTFLKNFYELCAEKGVRKMLHAGDLVEGNGKVYRGQEYEVFIHGTDAMVNYVTDIYPKIDGVKTYMIAGNHDESYWKTSGYNIVKNVAQRRDDIEYLGLNGAYIEIGELSVYLMHGSGGVAYARSYKLQKIIEQISPKNKPHLLLLGHFHVGAYIPMYRNVEGFQLPCFQSQTPYLKAKGRYPTLAGMILTIKTDKNGLYSIKNKWKHYYKPITHDF